VADEGTIKPVPADASPPTPDANSEKEQKLFASPDETRREALKQSIHWGIIIAVRVAAVCVILLFVVRIWHLGSPDKGRWLSAEELQQIDHLLFSGALGGFLVRYLGEATNTKIRLPKTNDED
jgi:hypothetical protein